jgi:hypothetical protein
MEKLIDELDRWSRIAAYIAIVLAVILIIIPAIVRVW